MTTELPPDTVHRFGGIARLYGVPALHHFVNAKVAVIGIGGVGSWAVEALSRSGIGTLTLIDLDEICLTNVNRQLHAMDGQIGKLKTQAMAERASAIHPAANVRCLDMFFGEKNAGEILDEGHFDAIVDAIDHVKAKTLLLAEAVARSIPIVSCGAAGGRRDPSRLQVADLSRVTNDPLLANVRKNLRSRHGFPKGETNKKPKPFGIEAVFSTEAPMFPQCDGSVGHSREAGSSLALRCDSGYGTATPMTATMGMMAAARVLEKLAAKTA